MELLRDAYHQFIHRVPFYGLAVLCIDNVNVRALLPQVRKRFVTYGTTPDADWQARDLRVTGLETAFEVWRGERRLGPVRLHMPGRHHALNALAALAVAEDLEIPFRIAVHALRRRGHLDVCHVPARERVAEALAELVRPGDLVLTLGAGDIHRTGDELLDLLRSGVAVPAIH